MDHEHEMLFSEFDTAIDELIGASRALREAFTAAFPPMPKPVRRRAGELMAVQALHYHGLSEIKGALHNDLIVHAFAVAGASWIRNDEAAWCAAFMCLVAQESGCENPKTVRAFNWESWGEPTDEPLPGDVVVLTTSHVGLFVNERDGEVSLLGGNQDSRVCIKSYPAHRVQAYRRGWVVETEGKVA